jgi:hypothetical protein
LEIHQHGEYLVGGGHRAQGRPGGPARSQSVPSLTDYLVRHRLGQ